MPAPAPEAAEAAPAVPKTELEELQMKAQHQTDEVSVKFNLNLLPKFLFFFFFFLVFGEYTSYDSTL